MRLLISSVFTHGLHKSRITHIVGPRLLTGSCVLQIESIATAPLPRIVQVEHSHHLTLAHLLQQVVETCQDGIVIYAGLHLQCRLHLGGHATLAVRTHQNAQVVNTHLLHQVELLAQTLTVSPLPFRAKDGTIPEIGSYVIIGLTVFDEMSILHLHKRRRLSQDSLLTKRQHHTRDNCN